MRSAWISAVVLPVRRAISPGCGVRIRVRLDRPEACPTSASASNTIGPSNVAAMFFIGALPAVLILFIRRGVQESPAWTREHSRAPAGAARKTAGIWTTIRTRLPLFLYMIVLMAAFNGFSHGTQDLYPGGFLEKQRGLQLGAVT